MVEIRRKLYKRGSSFETTIPMPILLILDKKKKYNVIFSYDEESNKVYQDRDHITYYLKSDLNVINWMTERPILYIKTDRLYPKKRRS